MGAPSPQTAASSPSATAPSRATLSAGGGGAIFNIQDHNGQVYISDSTFMNNSTAGNGGALQTLGTLTIARSTFDGNSSVGSAGAMYVSGMWRSMTA